MTKETIDMLIVGAAVLLAVGFGFIGWWCGKD